MTQQERDLEYYRAECLVLMHDINAMEADGKACSKAWYARKDELQEALRLYSRAGCAMHDLFSLVREAELPYLVRDGMTMAVLGSFSTFKDAQESAHLWAQSMDDMVVITDSTSEIVLEEASE